MAELVYKTSVEIPRPVILGHEALLKLDGILEEYWQILNKHREESIQRQIDREMEEGLTQYPSLYNEEQKKVSLRGRVEKQLAQRYADDALSISIHFSDDTKLSVRSFSEAMRHHHVTNKTPDGFRVSLRCGEVRCIVALRDDSGGLAIEVSPEGSPNANDLFGALKDWAMRSRAPSWQRFWHRRRALVVLLWWLWTSSVLAVPLVIYSEATKTDYKAEAAKLLSKGLSSGDQLKATEIMLALASDYTPARVVRFTLPGWYWFLTVGGLALCLILSFPPNCVIGLGAGEARVRGWRVWLKLVFYSVPIFLFTTFLLPFLVRLVRILLHLPAS
jgi:hypothetical protein